MNKVCKCGAKETELHKSDCVVLKTRLERRKETKNRFLSAGYKPTSDEKVEVRGD